jgi:cytochrome b pre-mRNA-processing protein 3
MVLSFFRRDPRRPVIETLYGRIAATARQPGLYLALGVPDTLEGRFGSLVLHAVVVLRRLRRLPPPADEVAQDLVDALFRELDRSLRELGVGDFGVPKRMRTLAQAFHARAERYDSRLEAADEAALAEALGADLNDGRVPLPALARYAIAAETELAGLDLDRLLRDGPRFPPPERFAAP